MRKEYLKEEVKKVLEFIEEAGYPASSVEDIHEGYISLKEAVLEVLESSKIEYDEEKIDEIIEKALEEYKLAS